MAGVRAIEGGGEDAVREEGAVGGARVLEQEWLGIEMNSNSAKAHNECNEPSPKATHATQCEVNICKQSSQKQDPSRASVAPLAPAFLTCEIAGRCVKTDV
jgi:hypothetical protein